MKLKHLNIDNLPLTDESYIELRKALKLGKLKWINLSKELQDAYHSFDEDKREVDFEMKIHKIARGTFDFNKPI